MRRLLAALGVALLAAAAVADDSALLPGDGVPAGFTRTAKARVFPGSELYGYIDGGAEIFLELGFEALTVQPYLAGEEKITAELYRMRDATAALAIYLARAGVETPVAGLAQRHTAGSHQLMLVKGSYFLTVNDDSGRSADAGPLVEVARAVAARIPPAAPLDTTTVLPAEGLVPGSLRLIRGPVGLESIITLGEGDVLLLGGRVTAVAGEYPDGAGARFMRIVADYPAADGASAAFAHLVAHLDPTIVVLRRGEGSLVFRDFAGRFGSVALGGARLSLAVNLAHEPAAP